MSIIQEILSPDLTQKFGVTDGSAASYAYGSIVGLIKERLGAEVAGALDDDEFRLTYTPRISMGTHADQESLGVIHLDWIEGSNPDGKIRIIRCEAPDASGSRGSQITYLVGTTNEQWLLGFLMRYG